MKFSIVSIVVLLWVSLLSAAIASPESARPSNSVNSLGQDFSISEGDHVNWFLSAGNASSHTIVTNERNPRILVTYPDDNVGTAVWFDRSVNPGLNLRFTAPPRVMETTDGEGVDAQLVANRSSVVITDYALDSVRVIRMHATEEGGRLDPSGARKMRAGHKDRSLPGTWHAETAILDGNRLVLERGTANDQPKPGGRRERFSLAFILPAGARLERVEARSDGASRFRLSTEDGSPLSFGLQSRIPVKPMRPFVPEELLRPEVLETMRRLDGLADAPSAAPSVVADRNAFAAALRGLLFLSRREKYMAGAWRFMTYFGRDTMISIMLLRDILTPRAYSDGIQSVLDRLSPDGDVAHEEDLGPFAEMRRLLDPRLPGRFTDPVYDYKMIDDDVLLPIMEALYLTDSRVALEDRRAFLSRPGNLEKVLANWDFVIGSAEKWAQSHGRDYRALIRLRPGLQVGNWRDSQAGLGLGTYPSDVNIDLVPTALASIDEIVRSGMITPDHLRASGRPHLAAALDLQAMQSEWNKSAERFRVTLDADEIRKRLSTFLEKAGLDDAQRAYHLSQRFAGRTTLSDFLQGKTPPELQQPLQFSALALDDRGQAVPVMNSDFGFRLFFQDPSPEEVSQLLRLVELPYPVGLMTPVGPVVANAAYSRNPEHWRDLGRDSYHGAVIWSWQASLLESGLLRQFARFRADPALAGLAVRLQAAANRLIDTRRAAGALAGSELWTWEIDRGRMKALAFGQREGSDTESNAVQLWSTIFPSLYLKEQGMGLTGTRPW